MRTKGSLPPRAALIGILFLLYGVSCKNKADEANLLGIHLFDSTLTYKEYDYPEVKYPLISFSVMPPGIIMLPVLGGVYMPNFKTWYLQPDKEPLLSVTTDLTDGTLYYCKNFGNTSLILQVGKNNNSTNVAIVDTFMRGFYNVIATGHAAYYVMGLNAKGYHIWQRDKQRRQLLFESNGPVTAFSAINRDAFLMCLDKKLILFKKGRDAVVLGTFDKAVDGIAVDGSGKIFVSSGNIIYQIISKNEFKPVISGIHGVLQYLDGNLYVLSQEKSKVVVFKMLPVAADNANTKNGIIIDDKAP